MAYPKLTLRGRMAMKRTQIRKVEWTRSIKHLSSCIYCDWRTVANGFFEYITFSKMMMQFDVFLCFFRLTRKQLYKQIRGTFLRSQIH